MDTGKFTREALLMNLKMNLKSLCFLLAAVCVLTASGLAPAQTPGIEPVYLQDKYYFGMPWESVAAVPRMGPCEGMDPHEVLCSEDGMFAGLKWSRLFFFEKEQLIRVMLYSEDIQRNFGPTLKTMDQRGYTLVALTNGEDVTFDIPGEAAGKSPQELETAMAAFEKSAIDGARVMYTYFNTDSKPEGGTGKGGWSAWAEAAPDSLRMAQVELSLPKYVRITFSAPKAQLTP